MAENLAAFLAENALMEKPEKVVVSKRFMQEGKPVEWEIRCISSKEDEEIRKECTRQVTVPGKKRQYMPQTDLDLYTGKLAAACVVYPDLTSAQLQDSYHVMGAEALLKRMLLPGEYADLILAVQEINGYNKDMQELVDEAKN